MQWKCLKRWFLHTFRHRLLTLWIPYNLHTKNRSVEDAIPHVLNNIYVHLDKPDISIRLMFYDYSSAFNTIQPHILAQKMADKNISPFTVLWILNYLTSRPQHVKLCDTIRSDVHFANTGAPQGTVLSPFLFSVFTADCRFSHPNCDTVLTGLISNDEDSHYRQEIGDFVRWCEGNYLVLNAGKTKRWLLTFERRNTSLNPLRFEGMQSNE